MQRHLPASNAELFGVLVIQYHPRLSPPIEKYIISKPFLVLISSFMPLQQFRFFQYDFLFLALHFMRFLYTVRFCFLLSPRILLFHSFFYFILFLLVLDFCSLFFFPVVLHFPIYPPASFPCIHSIYHLSIAFFLSFYSHITRVHTLITIYTERERLVFLFASCSFGLQWREPFGDSLIKTLYSLRAIRMASVYVMIGQRKRKEGRK